MANLGEKGKFRQKWRMCQKFIKGFAKYSNEITKRGILTNSDFTKMTNLEKKLFKVWQKLKQDDKRGMSIIVGFTKMTYFAKPANFGKDWDNETTKQSYWQLAIFTKINHDLVKPRMRWQRGEYWQKTNFDKYGVPKIHQGFGQIFKWDDKKGYVDSWRFLGQLTIFEFPIIHSVCPPNFA